jgi:hypothetical protein
MGGHPACNMARKGWSSVAKWTCKLVKQCTGERIRKACYSTLAQALASNGFQPSFFGWMARLIRSKLPLLQKRLEKNRTLEARTSTANHMNF